jgi:hypothetical protein
VAQFASRYEKLYTLHVLCSNFLLVCARPRKIVLTACSVVTNTCALLCAGGLVFVRCTLTNHLVDFIQALPFFRSWRDEVRILGVEKLVLSPHKS